MFFSKSCEYAIRATIYLAKAKKEERIGIKVIAKDLDLPASYLNKVLQTLVKERIVSSVKGRNGGFFLTNSELNSPLIRIVLAIDGEDIFLRCGLGMSACSNTKPCPLHNDIKEYRDNLQKALSTSTIASTHKGINAGETFLVR